MRDLPALDKEVRLYVDAEQGYGTICMRYHTLRPELCHPLCGYSGAS